VAKAQKKTSKATAVKRKTPAAKKGKGKGKK